MIPAHSKNLCEVMKKSLQGTSNSHNPLLTRTSAQSESALKVRGDVYTYINHEQSHHKKNSNAHKRHSASTCKHFSSSSFISASPRHLSGFSPRTSRSVFFMIHLVFVANTPVKMNCTGQLFLLSLR